MGDGDINKDVPDLCHGFTKCAFPSAATQFGNVVANNNVTILADSDHRQAVILEFTANEQTMEAMSRAGTKYILLESFGPGENAMFDAYFNGEISDRTMHHIITELSPLGLKELMDTDEGHQVNALSDLLKNARDVGIRVQGINGMEGAEGEMVEELLRGRETATMAVAKAIDANPAYFDLPEEEKNEFLRSQLELSGLDAEQIGYQMLMMGRVPMSEEMVDNIDMDFLIRRLEADGAVADRVKEITGGDKAVIIYGAHHLGRTGGDLDDLLGAKTVAIYADKETYERDIKPAADEIFNGLGMKMDDGADYSLDFKERIWRDEKNDIAFPVDVPGVPSLPDSYEKKTIPVPEVRPLPEPAPL